MIRKERGFTLIELMVVVLIIAILVAIAVPVFNVARESAQKRTCQANLRTIDGAITTYKATEDVYPPTGPLDDQHPLITEKYLKAPPKCPKAEALYTIAPGDPPYAVCPNIPPHTY
ncbi:MAG: type II secretion system protein [Actinomycetota bacterium]|nr:type II secretion system protein [Actinomycetota bacterium]MDI6821400.1 type II secretion system protein [Actinomycetota bacterium]